jgi:hypothetical protein
LVLVYKDFTDVDFAETACQKLLATFLGLAKVGFRKYQCSNLVQKIIETTNVQPSTKAPLLPNPCYLLAFFILLFC